MIEYQEISAAEVPANLVWATPQRHQGQIVEVSYSRGIPDGNAVNYDADEGDQYKRVVDHSDGSTWYARRFDPWALDPEVRHAILLLWDRTTRSRPTWAFVERLLGESRRGQLVDLGLIEQDPDFSGCWRYTDRAHIVHDAVHPDDSNTT